MPMPTHNVAVARNTFNQAHDTEKKIADRIDAKRMEIAGLEASRDELALEVILDEQGAKEKYDALQAKVERAEGELKLLETAGLEAQRRAEKAASARRVAEKVELRRNQAKLRQKQIKCAEKITEALVTVRDAMHELQALGDRIAATLPNAPESGFLISAPELWLGVGLEGWRLSERPEGLLGNEFMRLPGALEARDAAGHLFTGPHEGRPDVERCRSLADRIRDAGMFTDEVVAEKRDLEGREGPGAETYEPIDLESRP